MYQQPIVDSHVHLWDPARLNYAWHAEVPALNRPFVLADYDLARGDAQVEQIVFVQCEADREDSMKEVAWITEVSEQDKRLRGMVAFAPLEKGAAAKDHVAELFDNKLVKGVRRLIQEEPLGFCVQPEFVSGVQLLHEFDLSCDLCIYHPQMADAIRLVKQCPNVRFVLDHIGKPDIKSRKEDPWKAQLKELAGMKNVWCKISGMITEADHENWKPTQLAPYLTHAIECFGIDRVLFGSDWPVITLAGKWSDWLSILSDEIKSYSAAEQNKLMHDNAIEFYRLAK